MGSCRVTDHRLEAASSRVSNQVSPWSSRWFGLVLASYGAGLGSVGRCGYPAEARRRYDSFDELIKGGMSGAEASTEFAPSQCWVPFSCS